MTIQPSLDQGIVDMYRDAFYPANTSNLATVRPNSTGSPEKMLDRLFPENEYNRIPEEIEEGGFKEVAAQFVNIMGVGALAVYGHFHLDVPALMSQAYGSIEPFFSVLDRLENIPYQLPVATGSLAVMAAGVCIKIIDSYKK